MTDQRVIQTAEAEQVPMYTATQAEVRYALERVIAEDQKAHQQSGPELFIPTRIHSLIREAFDRANAGEFRA